jgi:hypothetical protein
LTEGLTEAVRVFVRYETPDHENKTRRERNHAFGQESPPLEIPENGSHLWAFFLELNQARQERYLFSFQEIDAWMRLTGNRLLRQEIRIIKAMDVAYINQLNQEIEDTKARMRGST